jgi:hypothetical protein
LIGTIEYELIDTKKDMEIAELKFNNERLFMCARDEIMKQVIIDPSQPIFFALIGLLFWAKAQELVRRLFVVKECGGNDRWKRLPASACLNFVRVAPPPLQQRHQPQPPPSPPTTTNTTATPIHV